ncbi:hypothetical protein [Paenibacillus sp.]|uniref:hypothetical protein n=1 Tax=Paenibacillus sp. TaxID=58172 RepID=UPI00281256AE|nr:hypothetical protein [Paenibacillus sp.]
MESASTLAAARERLERLHIRLTPLRRAVLETMHGEAARPSVDALCRLLRPRFPRVNATAVRNAVLVFDKLGLLPPSDGGGSSRAG